MNGGKRSINKELLPVQQTNNSRNTEIDFFRILMAFVIVIHHSHGLRPVDATRYPFVGGYLAVEFFFILSGYFATKRAMMYSEADYKSAISWTWRKFQRIFTYVIPAVAIHYLANAFVSRTGLFGTVKSLLYSVFEMMLMPATGLYESFLVWPLWYLSAMLILLPLFYSAMLKWRNFFLYVLCPVLVLLIYGWFSVTTQHIDRWQDWNGLFFMSLPKAWAGLSLGGLVYCAAKKLKSLKFTKQGQTMLSCIELICLGIVMFYMFTRSHRRLDFLCIGLLAVFATICLSEKTNISAKIPAVFSKISEYSLSLYVSHWTVRMLVPVIMPTATYWQMLPVYIALSAIYALVYMLVISEVCRLGITKMLKRLMIE